MHTAKMHSHSPIIEDYTHKIIQNQKCQMPLHVNTQS